MAGYTIFGYGGAYARNMLVGRLVGPEGTPQRTQEESFPGIDGAFSLYHGKSPRILQFDGFVYFTNDNDGPANILAWIIGSQAYTNFVGTLYQPFANSGQSYLYCRLNEYRRNGPLGFNSAYVFQKIRMAVTQLVW